MKWKCPLKSLYVIEVVLIVLIVYLVYDVRYAGSGRTAGSSSVLQVQKMSAAMYLNKPNTDCSDLHCVDYLTEEERVQYDSCYNATVSERARTKFGPIRPGKCRFQRGDQRYPVGLGSFQGSGNTWLRGLLEKITGICTGMYCNGVLIGLYIMCDQ